MFCFYLFRGVKKMVFDLIFYLFLYYLELALESIHPLDDAVVFFDTR